MAQRTTGRPAGRGGNGRHLSVVDNKGPELTPEQAAIKASEEQRQREEAEGIQLISVVGQVKTALVKVEAKRAELKTEQDAANDIFRAAKLASKDFTRERIMELVKDTKPEGRRDVVHNEAVRARFRKLMGLPTGLSDTEQELEARLPEVERNGLYYRGIGYTDGVSGNPHNVPEGCAAAGHGNRYDEGYKDGQKILMESSKLAGKKPAPVAVAPAPKEETAAERKLREAREATAARAGLEKLDGACADCGAAAGAPHEDGCPVKLKAESVAGGLAQPADEAEAV